VHVTTDVFNVVINLKGGELDQADLLQYPLRKMRRIFPSDS